MTRCFRVKCKSRAGTGAGAHLRTSAPALPSNFIIFKGTIVTYARGPSHSGKKERNLMKSQTRRNSIRTLCGRIPSAPRRVFARCYLGRRVRACRGFCSRRVGPRKGHALVLKESNGGDAGTAAAKSASLLIYARASLRRPSGRIEAARRRAHCAARKGKGPPVRFFT